MKFTADLHIHSHYSRATSRDMTIAALDKWAAWKGISVIGSGDFTHPFWLSELQKILEPVEEGFFRYKDNPESNIRFILTGEVSSIYSKGGRVRKIHNIIFAPSFEVALKINEALGKIGNLQSDGRPILGLDSEKLLSIVLNVSTEAFLVPAHIWTPWFSLFGSNSGFDSIEECFGKLSPEIFAIETGLSSDPLMNRMVSQLDKVTIISNSDAHSPAKIGREFNMLDAEFSYYGIKNALRQKDGNRVLSTIEFFPEEGKYHFDGHRSCGELSFDPEQTKKHKGICPVCNRPLTIGVMNRVVQLADRSEEEAKKIAPPFVKLIPLQEVIAECIGKGVGTESVQSNYRKLVETFGNELFVLREVSKADLAKVSEERIAEGIVRVREGKVKIKPGYDGVFGEIKIFGIGEDEVREVVEEKKETKLEQQSLF